MFLAKAYSQSRAKQASISGVGTEIVLTESVRRSEMLRQVGCTGTSVTDRAYGRVGVVSHGTKLSLKMT